MFDKLDLTLISWLTHFAKHSWVFDYFVYSISDNNLLKGGLFLTSFWGLWFRRSDRHPNDRALLFAALFACTVAIAINQGIQWVSFRPRPYISNLPGITFPYDLGMKKESSFPSDHAALFFSLSTGFWFYSRRLGIVTTLYTIVVICVPRVYLGLHYPSDLFAGAVIGVTCACLIVGTRLRGMVARPALAFEEKHPGVFYASLFLFTSLLATLLDSLRSLGSLLHVVIHAMGS